MNGLELEEKYGITIIFFPLYNELENEYCLCGHHAMQHSGKGSAGRCEMCKTPPESCHNFMPRQAREEVEEYIQQQKGNKLR